jgi:hypothetical protein
MDSLPLSALEAIQSKVQQLITDQHSFVTLSAFSEGRKRRREMLEVNKGLQHLLLSPLLFSLLS